MVAVSPQKMSSHRAMVGVCMVGFIVVGGVVVVQLVFGGWGYSVVSCLARLVAWTVAAAWCCFIF